MTSRLAAAVLFVAALALAPLDAQQERPRPAPQQPQQPAPPAPAPNTRDEPGRRPLSTREVAGPNEETISRTSHALRVNGRELRYTATAGTLPIRLDDGKVSARMFFVAYTRDDANAAARPVSFLFNGGPGSATIWLHMGSFGPRRVQMAEEGLQPAPPFELLDNEYTLLDSTDVVFVDAISTGYSRVVEGVDPAQFHGVQGDIRAFSEFVREYLFEYGRWRSPKYLIGESYGSIRAAGLAQELQSRHGIELNGVVLLSALLTYQTLAPSPQNDIALMSFVQTYAATGWYHEKLAPELQRATLDAVVDEARTFAFGEYAHALIRGNSLPDAQRQAVAQKFARLTGVSPEFVMRTNLRVDPARYRKELLRDRRLAVGRLDSRFTAVDLDAAGDTQEFDPSNTALQGAYTALFSDYVRHELKWSSDLHYATSGNVRPWNYEPYTNRYMDMTEALRQTMAKNPFLRVLVLAGYYDMATPVGGIEYNVWHLGYDPTFTARTSIAYYEGGHMMYIRPSAHRKLTEDMARFIAGETRTQTTTR